MTYTAALWIEGEIVMVESPTMEALKAECDFLDPPAYDPTEPDWLQPPARFNLKTEWNIK